MSGFSEHMKRPVEFFDVNPYPGEVSPEARATLESDPSAGGASGEEGETEDFPFAHGLG
jgi:hypothetical protein